MDLDLMPQEPCAPFWRGVAGGAFALALVGVWAWQGLGWAVIALIAVIIGAVIGRTCRE